METYEVYSRHGFAGTYADLAALRRGLEYLDAVGDLDENSYVLRKRVKQFSLDAAWRLIRDDKGGH